ncbi:MULTISPECIES: ATP-dependent Zn protease [unclassified Leptolyngbya]|uniref:ATP-dependent Zn protease n=1 Tax=unclassified Leptolyngbya TaxID=2650499 RepID=UPI00168290B4|nr:MULTISPECIES: ATP-dependent Zn protease [unclassified Leptolyngbya]MBD1911074.1 ATP-dependent Zn protease [Leptolyngbya sp. FACHB-8]MBD2158260.1 ATP-dependent Zn protease [Leptolyngbya sp. FACHB-16]
MNQLSFNLIAIGVFVVVMTSLLGPLIHLSPVVPAVTVAGIMGLAALDTLGWQNRGSTLLLDWIAQFSAEHRDRILHHEAGHLLVAQKVGIPVTGYTLTAWEAFRLGQPGNGGVQFDTTELDAELNQGKLSSTLIDRYCIVWMAGIAAETLTYGSAEGGAGDREQIQLLFNVLKRPASEATQKERWAILQAKTLLQEAQDVYEPLVEAMRSRQPVSICQQLVSEKN